MTTTKEKPTRTDLLAELKNLKKGGFNSIGVAGMMSALHGVDKDEVESTDPDYKHLRDTLNDLAEDGLVSKEKDGRSNVYSITEDGLDHLNGDRTADEEATLPELVKVSPEADLDEYEGAVGIVMGGGPADKLQVRWEEDDGRVVGTEPISHDKVEPIEEREEAFPAEEDSEEETDEPEGDTDHLDAVLNGGDGMDTEIPEPQDTETGEEPDREKKRVPRYWKEIAGEDAPDGKKTIWTRYKNGYPACPHTWKIIHLDPVEAGLLDEEGNPTHPDADKIRTECPECGSIRVSKTNSKGELKLHGHEYSSIDVAKRMDEPFIRHTENGLEWVDPTEEEMPERVDPGSEPWEDVEG